jgi:hypothetical protein
MAKSRFHLPERRGGNHLAEKKQNAAIKDVVGEAVEQLFAKEGFLLEANAAERTIAARLAVHLEPRFPGYHVNVEYNRQGLDPKRLNLPASGGEKLILPDVVVHRQGHDENNLPVIQVKKETNNESRDYDRAVIAGMKQDYGYTWGVLIDLPAGPGATGRKTHLEWV